jgi:hypothetical protein
LAVSASSRPCPRSFARASTSSPRHSSRSPRTGKLANPRRWTALRTPPRFADEASHGPGTHALLIASIIQDCVRDLHRVIGAEQEQ